ncbi:hypothetical protein RMN56_22830 [Micromonospora halotolerans]|uniref:Uncharacterized protein n=1 Tax=Micromonospora halotolerans TaxID=709879 RepID=A0ABY9ZRM9_9ACTN|nr:hypothetical protein [Micromonospora halotolerans]WNM37954.1 hypothetical protein RMN56_22830 [Micromonospora halotolerans]
MEDVDDAREFVEQRMRATGFEEDILDKVMDLLERFDTNREKLFEEMLSKLEQPGYDGLTDRWETNCEQAEALMERLESDIRSVLEDSQANAMSVDERWTAVGPRDFLAGERKIWAQVARLDVPEVATLMSKVLEADLALIKKCEEDLKNARSNDAIVEQLLLKNFGSIQDTVKSLLVKYLPTSGVRLIVLFMKDPSSKEVANEAIKNFEKLTAENLMAAKQKRAAKQTVVDNIKLLTAAREQLDEDWIDKLFARGAEAAGNWRGIGASGDYRATDWDWMKENVLDRGLDTRAEAAKEQSSKLYDELFPTLVEESTNAFAQLTDDPDTLAKFNEELEKASESLESLLATEEEYVKDLAEGPYKQTGLAAFAQVIDAVKVGFKLLADKTEEADDEVKKS